MKDLLFEIEPLKKSTESKNCHDCVHCEFVATKFLCVYWMVGFDMRGLEPCEHFKE